VRRDLVIDASAVLAVLLQEPEKQAIVNAHFEFTRRNIGPILPKKIEELRILRAFTDRPF
jgi:hypothetical protein